MRKVCVILIFILALFLRVYKLGSYPAGFLWDEASLGYNAYSILKTGRDEYGKFLPIIFKSFGDYKPGLYVYLTVPSVLIFGLNEFAVRLPSAVAGSLTVILLYLLLIATNLKTPCVSKGDEDFLSAKREDKRLSSRLKLEDTPTVRSGSFIEAKFTQIGKQILRQAQDRFSADSVPIVAALFLALNPWHISFSRGAWELNVMTFEIVLGFFLLLRFLCSKKTYLLYLSVLVFLLSLLTYQGAKFLVPVLLLGFVFFFREYLKEVPKKQKIVFLTVFFSGFFLFNFLTLVGGKAGRIKVMSLFSYPRSTQETNTIQSQDNRNDFYWDIFHSSPIFFTRSVLSRYFNHLSGRFLFFDGDWSNLRNGVIYQGVLYYTDIVFLLLGFWVLVSKERNGLDNLMLFWLLLAPLPAALTRDSISSVRSFTMVIPLIYCSALGLSGLIQFFAEKKLIFKLFVYCLLFTVYCFCFIRFLDLYFTHDPIFTSKDRLYGYKEMFNIVAPFIDSKKKVVVTTAYGQPYIFYLFYTKFPPREYQKVAKLWENPYGDVGVVEKIGNIEFRTISWPGERADKNSLFIGDEFDLPLQDIIGQENIYFLKEIKFLNGKTAFRIVETR